MSETFNILRFGPIRSRARLGQVETHNRRLTLAPNIDPHRCTLNQDLMRVEWGDTPFLERIDAVLKRYGITPHKGGVLAYEMLMGMSPGAEGSLDVTRWAKDALNFARRVAGNGNLLSCDLHLDETTPHLHAVAVPIVNAYRKARGPAPRSGQRLSQEKAVLSWAGFAGHTTKEVACSFSRWHDEYAAHMHHFGLQRGTHGGCREHIPQRELHANATEIETMADALMKFLKNPALLFAGLKPPAVSDLAGESTWLAYQAGVARHVSGITTPMLENLDGLVTRAKRSVFTRAVSEKLASLAADRDVWRKNSHAAERDRDASRAEQSLLGARLRDLDGLHRPVTPREAAEILGAHVVGIKVGGGYVDRVANAKGEVLTLEREHFRKPDGIAHSVVKYLQDELGLSSSASVLLLLEERVGRDRANATMAAAVRLACVIQKLTPPPVHGGNSSVRLLRLQNELQTHVGISRIATSKLIEDRILTVDGRGRGVLLPSAGGRGCVFDVNPRGCELIVPLVDTIVSLGAPKTDTAVLCDDPAVALRVFDATMGQVASHLVGTHSVTEALLNRVKTGHREMLSYPSVFAPGWDPAQSVVLRPPDQCVVMAAELMRSVDSLDAGEVPEQSRGHGGMTL